MAASSDLIDKRGRRQKGRKDEGAATFVAAPSFCFPSDSDYGTGASVVPYLALIASMRAFAISLWAGAAGCAPSSEMSVPKVAVVLLNFGKRGMALVALFAARIGFGSTYANPIAAAFA